MVAPLRFTLAVAGVDFVEESEITGNRFGQFAVGGGCKRNAAAGGFFLPEKFKNLLPVRKTGGVQMHPGSELSFE